MSRKKARDNSFKCIYQIEFLNKEDIDLDEILSYCFEENTNTDEEKKYIITTFKGVCEKLQEIDNVILSKLKNWEISRISKVDLAILRLAIYEINYMENIPVKVSANEAVELAKTYGNPKSKSFVNGVIAKIIEEGNKK